MIKTSTSPKNIYRSLKMDMKKRQRSFVVKEIQIKTK